MPPLSLPPITSQRWLAMAHGKQQKIQRRSLNTGAPSNISAIAAIGLFGLMAKDQAIWHLDWAPFFHPNHQRDATYCPIINDGNVRSMHYQNHMQSIEQSCVNIQNIERTAFDINRMPPTSAATTFPASLSLGTSRSPDKCPSVRKTNDHQYFRFEAMPYQKDAKGCCVVSGL